MSDFLCAVWEKACLAWGALVGWWYPVEVELTPFEAREKIHELDLQQHLTKIIYYYKPDKIAKA
jgi:hypothetical protein